MPAGLPIAHLLQTSGRPQGRALREEGPEAEVPLLEAAATLGFVHTSLRAETFLT